jgi:hypothetical protein
MHLRFDAGGAAEAAAVGDPVATAAVDVVARTAPLGRGEHLLVGRSWMGVDGHHVPASPTFQAMATADTALWLTEPGLAVSMLWMTDAATWTPMFGYIDHAHAADVAAAGRRYAGFLHDWRVTPPAAWLELMEPRELGDHDRALEHAQRHLRARPLLALSRPDFDRHVREALRAAGRPADLGRSPLLRTRLVAPPGRAAATAADLRAVLERGVAALARDPEAADRARVLEVTHLRPGGGTQEAAAARLHLPFSTYRRHLRAATEALTEVLWVWELHGAGEMGDDAP